MQIPRLREERELQGLTQKELADVSGVSVRSVAGYESGASVRPNTARKLAEALDVKVADLVGVDARPKSRGLSPRDTEPATALPDDEVLLEAAYSPEDFEEVMAKAEEVWREAARLPLPEGMHIALLISGDKVEVRIVPATPSSSARRARRSTRARSGRETG